MKLLRNITDAVASGLGYTVISTTRLENRLKQAWAAAERGIAKHTCARIAGHQTVIPPNPSRTTVLHQDIKILFQPAYYQAVYPDIDYAGQSPLEHYMTIGWKEGKNPNPYLYSNWYMEKYPDAAVSGLNPLDHYICIGAAKGYDPSPRFSTRAYKALYPGVGVGNPLAYHFQFGMSEGNLCVRPSMAERVLAACSPRYPDSWMRRFTVPFAPALAYDDDREDFDTTVQSFCDRLKTAVKVAGQTNGWMASVSFACEGSLNQVNFRGGMVTVNHALASWSSGVDCFAPSYFLFLVLKTIAECCPGSSDHLVTCIPEDWKLHPAVWTALALWDLQVGDNDGFQHERARLAASYLHSNVEHFDIMRLETNFARGYSDGLPSWYYAMHGHYCRRPFERITWSNDTHRIHPTLCCSLHAPFHLQAEKKHSRNKSAWNSASAMEFRRSIIDGDFTYCRRSVCPEILLKRLPKKTDGKLNIIQPFKNTGQIPSTPKIIVLALDWTCNLACPACRKEHYQPKAGEIEKLITCYEHEIKPLLCEGPLNLSLDGSGEALISKLGRRILQDFRAIGNHQSELFLMTNAQLLTKKVWDTWLAGLNVTCRVSIDAACQKTYEVVRYPGKWDILCRNIEHLTYQLETGNLKALMTSFVVQKTNWLEMLEFAKLCKIWGVSECAYFHLINKVGYTMEENLEQDVLNPAHSCFAEASCLLDETRRYCENNGIVFITTGTGE